MDSVFDRGGEVIVYLGIVAGLQAAGVADGPLLAAAALGSAVMVSYTRSKSDGLGFTAGTGMAAVGIMPREVRLIILSLGLVLAGVLGANATGGAIPPGIAALFLALGVITVGSILTVIQRIVFVRRQATPSPTTTPAPERTNGDPS
jgi:CDP-diacylglycerol--glycerol-3-phosphate 3-phosphatidyltransferase